MPNRISRRRQKHSKGAVFLETGLVFVVFAFMLMGAFDFAAISFHPPGISGPRAVSGALRRS
jgi:hypothetical protein